MEISTYARGSQGDTYTDSGLAAVAVLRRGQELERRKVERLSAQSTETQILFARGRIKAIHACIEWECGRCNDPERGMEILAALLPYVVELSTLDDDLTFREARLLVSYWLPGAMEAMGPTGFRQKWDRCAEERSVAAASQHANPKHRGKAVYWCPKAETITRLFGLTRATRKAINERQAQYGGKPAIIGIPVIDPLSPDEKKAEDRERKSASNRAKGVRAQSSRTINKTLEAIAARGGPKIATLYRHKAKGDLLSYLNRKGVVLTETERKMIENFPRHNGRI